jgi:hypothetical protein
VVASALTLHAVEAQVGDHRRENKDSDTTEWVMDRRENKDSDTTEWVMDHLSSMEAKHNLAHM